MPSPSLFVFSWPLLGSMAEFNADSFWHGPVRGEDGCTFFVVIDQRSLQPGIASIYLVKPRWLQTFMEEHVIITELHFNEPLNQLLPGWTEGGRDGGRKRGREKREKNSTNRQIKERERRQTSSQNVCLCAYFADSPNASRTRQASWSSFLAPP